jgi:hypothetical protein
VLFVLVHGEQELFVQVHVAQALENHSLLIDLV